jgi:rod shape determining protein RodA
MIAIAHDLPEHTLGARLRRLHWGLMLLICCVATIGFLLLYSAAGGSFAPWLNRQLARFGVAFVIMLCVGLIPIRLWLRYAYVAYAIGLGLLVVVEFVGALGGGAERWINLGVIRLQPSEVMKIALIMALARYFHRLDFQRIGGILTLIPPILIVMVPAALVLKQPDLGTAVILVAVGAAIFFLAGVRWWMFAIAGALAAAVVPFVWSLMHGYQKKRLVAFLDPESDPLGAGYHIIQSKIALGSGGVFGKGFLQGTQIHLNFLPEMHTDFIFSVLAEEWGIVGGITLLVFYCLILFLTFRIGARCRHQFGRLLCAGVGFTFFLYLFINLAMVMGLLPVVGVPLPLVSYGGTSMLTLLFAFGLVLSVHAGGEERIGRFDDD